MIPKKLHWIWVGGAPMPQEYASYIERAQALHPDWSCRIWRDEDLEGFVTLDRIHEAATLAGKADIARYEVLAREGGVYLDCDMELLRPLDPLLEIADLVVCNEDEHIDRYCSIGFIAAVPAHPVLCRMVEALLDTDPNAGPVNETTGPFFFARHLGRSHAALPTSAFYPYHYSESPDVLANRNLSSSFGVHHWGGSWLPSSKQAALATKDAAGGRFQAAAQRLVEILKQEPTEAAAKVAYGRVAYQTICELSDFLRLEPQVGDEFFADLGSALFKAGSYESLLEGVVKARSAIEQVARAAQPQQTQPPVVASPVDTPRVRATLKSRLQTRTGTDDDKWVVPELVDQDMYRLTELAKLAPDSQVSILDCGAHIGVFSSLCAEYFPYAQVHAFEPQPDNYGMLVQNTACYGGRVKPHQVAVGTESGILSLYKQGKPEDGFTGRWSLTPEDDQPGQEHVDVQVIDLEGFISRLDAPVFMMKIDLEGFEAKILSTLSSKALSNIGILIIEEHHLAIDHQRIRQAGHQLVFHPLGSDRHFVYINSAALARMTVDALPARAVA